MKSDIDRMYDVLGIPSKRSHELSTDEPPIPVDDGKLRALLNDTLDFVTRDEVLFLVVNYQSWWDAYERVADELFKESLDKPHRVSAVGRLSERLVNRRFYAAALAVAATVLVGAFLLFRPEQVTQLADGRSVLRIAADGEIRGLESYPASWREAAEEAVTDGVPPSKVYEDLTDSLPALRSRGVGVSDAILSPFLTVVRETQPVLKWAALPNADRYRVELFILGQDEPLLTQELSETTWTIPNPLDRGQTYRWQVFYVVGDKTFIAPKADEKPAVFRVLDEAALQTLLKEEKELDGSKLLRGLLYAREGLLDDASQEWKRLKDDNPNSAVVSKLLDELGSLRRGTK